MAGKNVIYRGPIDRQPRTISDKPVAGAYLPGTFVEETATQLAQITTALAKNFLVLGALDFKDQTVTTAYTSGDTGVAFIPSPGDIYQASMAAATYAKGDPLTIAASGRLAAATTGTRVVAYFEDTAGAVAAGVLMDVVIADGYIVP